jgi:KDO2-lipid IV(A) lauroyltransferase
MPRFLHPRHWPTWVGVLLMRLISLLPMPVLWLLGVALGELIYFLAPSRRRVARRNIERCFPQLDAGARSRLVRTHFHALALGMLNLGVAWWASERRLARLIRLTDRHYYDEALAAGRNVILLTPHFVAVDFMVFLSRERPMIYVYQRARSALFDHYMRGGRTRFAGEAFERDDSFRGLVRRLRDQRPLVYLPDQNPGRKRGVFADFFGIPAATHPALGRLAQLSDAVVIPAIPRQLPGGAGIEIIFRPPLADFPTGDPERDAATMNAAIEQEVRRFPEQYVWVHKRFKVRPYGEPDFYA